LLGASKASGSRLIRCFSNFRARREKNDTLPTTLVRRRSKVSLNPGFWYLFADEDFFMRRRRLLQYWATTCLIAPLGLAAPCLAASPAKPLPSWEKVDQVARNYFEALSDRKPDDILSQDQVKPLLAQLERLGWKVPGAAGLLKRVPSEGDFIVKQFRTPAGTQFMRQIARYPDGYDRVDHLSRLPQGEAKVRELIRGPGGYKLIEYMTTAPGGVALGKMLSVDQGGRGFNSATGKLYTPSAVIEALKSSYTQTVTPSR